MADRSITERLQPSLLDRLTDDAPTERLESRDNRVIDIRRLRDIIRRDLSWLLNTNNSETTIDMVDYPNASRSVLNYGVREVSGDYSSDAHAEMMRNSIKRAIEYFEPRLRDGSVDVTLGKAEVARQTVIVFDIRAVMWAQPLPMELYLRSQVDVTTGQLHLEQRD